jgi:hypothetical protein
LNPTKLVISDETKRRIDKLLLEKLPLAGIARVEDVSESWLQGYVNQKVSRGRAASKGRAKKGGADH